MSNDKVTDRNSNNPEAFLLLLSEEFRPAALPNFPDRLREDCGIDSLGILMLVEAIEEAALNGDGARVMFPEWITVTDAYQYYLGLLLHPGPVPAD